LAVGVGVMRFLLGRGGVLNFDPHPRPLPTRGRGARRAGEALAQAWRRGDADV